ncbi:MAG: sulfatase [Planctomycetaceae bacterium]|nr:sulfatase [Planctomycetaceae bacterium]
MTALLTVAWIATTARAAEEERATIPPNVVLIFTDDQGYEDLGCFGSPDIDTPHLDQLAREGVRLTDFYVSQAVCSASRAALLTGCYSNRIGILGALGPKSNHGISSSELTIAEMLRERGYATAIFGKWHLGHHPQFLPTRHGFDQFFGLPYSNDMWPFHPVNPEAWPPLPMYENEKIIDAEVTGDDQTQLTTRYTERAVDFIQQNRERPFFLYVPHSMPHVPLYVSRKFAGKSSRGLYGDVIMEIDWSVGEILRTLKENGLDDQTLVIFTSDNGPWLSYGDHAGAVGVLREGKGTMWDGGCREPFIARWPGRIPAGAVCREVAGTIDILPTLAELTGGKLPDHAIDGKSIWPLLSGRKGARSPHEYYLFYYGRQLQAIRSGRWKLHFPHAYRSLKGEPGSGGKPGPYVQKQTGVALYDLVQDPSESVDLQDDFPEVVARLLQAGEAARNELGDNGRNGSGVRQPGRLAKQAP